LLRSFVDPPTFDYQQVIGVSLLCPAAFAFGAACSAGARVILGALGVSVAALVIVSIASGTFAPFAEHWQYLVTASAAENRTSSGYQGLSAIAGFATVSLLPSLQRHILNALFAIVFICVVVSTGHCNTVPNHRRWRLEAERLPRPAVEPSRHAVEFGLREA